MKHEESFISAVLPRVILSRQVPTTDCADKK